VDVHRATLVIVLAVSAVLLVLNALGVILGAGWLAQD
jgi:hypothetical protein